MPSRGGQHWPACQFDWQHCPQPLQSIAQQLGRGAEPLAEQQLKDYLYQHLPTRFFAGASDRYAIQQWGQSSAAEDIQARRDILDCANGVCRGEFTILGYGRLSFGRPVDWHFDPVSGRRAPQLHRRRIRPLDFAQVGDSKVVWELNRHQWLIELGQAFQLTGDQQYADCFSELLEQWLDANPPGFGINWSSALEAAMRMISWCWSLLLFRDAEALSPKLLHRMLGGMQHHARFIENNLSHYFSPNTHLTIEALGLFYIGTLFPEMRGARHWQQLGQKILLEQLDCQVYDDGVYFEQSSHYQCYTIDTYLHFLLLARRNQLILPAKLEEKLRCMVAVLLAWQRPDGSLPQLGDSDGGSLLPLRRRATGDGRGVFASAALALKHPGAAHAAGTMSAECHWLFDSEAARQWHKLVRPAQKLPALQCFQQGGYVVMRDQAGHSGHQLIFDAGPLGCGISGAHGHADLLSVQCSAWGENYLVDAGTACYTTDLGWRNYFRSTAAHNTLRVDGVEQAQVAGPFSWQSRPAARLNYCRRRPGLLLADAEHRAYCHLPDPVLHRRRVMFVDESYWLLVDDLLGAANHQIELYFQFAPVPVSDRGGGWVCARGQHSALMMKTFTDVETHCQLHCGERNPPRGWVSRAYGQRQQAPGISLTCSAKLPLRLVTLLLPMMDPDNKLPAASLLVEDGAIVGFRCAAGSTREVRF